MPGQRLLDESAQRLALAEAQETPRSLAVLPPAGMGTVTALHSLPFWGSTTAELPNTAAQEVEEAQRRT
jgi:hypothetical protein